MTNCLVDVDISRLVSFLVHPLNSRSFPDEGTRFVFSELEICLSLTALNGAWRSNRPGLPKFSQSFWIIKARLACCTTTYPISSFSFVTKHYTFGLSSSWFWWRRTFKPGNSLVTFLWKEKGRSWKQTRDGIWQLEKVYSVIQWVCQLFVPQLPP